MRKLKIRLLKTIVSKIKTLELRGAWDLTPNDQTLVVSTKSLSVTYGPYHFQHAPRVWTASGTAIDLHYPEHLTTDFTVVDLMSGKSITIPHWLNERDYELLRYPMRQLRVLLKGIELLLTTLPEVTVDQVNEGRIARHYAGACKLNANSTMGAHGEGMVRASGYLDEIRKRTKYKEHLKYCCDYISAYRKGYYATWTIPSET